MRLYSQHAIRILCLIGATVLSACGGNGSSPFNNMAFNVSSDKHLYVASGSCYGGGVTVSTGPANTISKYNLETGAFERVIVDYNQQAPGDSPVAIYDYDSSRLLVLVENTGGRRIDIVRKDGGGVASYLYNATAFSAVLRSFILLSDFSILVSKSTAIEKFNSGKARVTMGANPWVNAPAGTCATSTTLISSVTAHANGKIVYTHAAATPNNKIGVIKDTGYAAAADCLGGVAGPTTLALPTRAMFHSDGKLLVSYGSTTAASNFIYSYTFNATTGAITAPTAAFNDSGVIINGPSAMAEDPATGDVYVANVTSTFNTIERFHYASGILTRAGGSTFIPSSAYTRCVADMKVMN